MINVLVTGAGGQFGQALSRIKANYRELAFDFRDRVGLDITDPDMVFKILREKSFDYCINAAAYTDVDKAETNPADAFAVNTQGACNLARACNELGICLIQLSTDYVFDGTKAGPYLPGDPPNPINEYGKSKWEGEKCIQQLMSTYFIVRTSWLYSEFGQNFYTKILSKAHRGETLHVTDIQKGRPTRADHLAAYIAGRLIQERSNGFGIYHFTDGETMSWYDFALKILREHKLDETVRIVRDNKSRSFAARPVNSVLISNGN